LYSGIDRKAFNSIFPKGKNGDKMVFCPKCGAECPPDSVFCLKCGSKIPKHPQKSQQQSDFSHLKIAAIPLLVLAIFALITLVIFPGNPCRGVTCENQCRGTTLWKMKCIQGECVPDYPIEENSPECGYEPPAKTYEPDPESPQPETDTDNDGIPDSADNCHNPGCTLVDTQGCPKDSDGDELQDCYDECPYEKGEKTNKGCPAQVVSIEISTVNYNAPRNDNDNPNGEWVKIRNTGTQDVNMSGWRLYDDAYKYGTAPDHIFIFPSGFILKAGQSVTVYTGQGINTDSALYFGRAPGEYAAIWNNDGDCAYLVDDQGTLVDMYCWT
jgi:hypothetical protein